MWQVLNGYIMTKKKVAVIGGTFDPVHIGHVEMAKYLVNNNIVDEVWILPSYNSPHKNIDTINSYEHRINMLKLAFDGIDNVYISRYEEEYFNLHKDTKTYTYEILEGLRNKYNDVEFSFVVGFDSIKDIGTWHRYLELIRDYYFYIFSRNDDEFKTMEQKKFYIDNLGKHQGIGFRYTMFDYELPNISSTSIREMIKNKEKYNNVLSVFLDSKVIEYIKENKLYL